MAFNRIQARKYRKQRVRRKVTGTTERPRLSVFRSLNHISAQVIDDSTGTTLASVSSAEKTVDAKGATKACAEQIGALIAQRAKEKSVTKVTFDRNGYLYHGRVKALADAAREHGLEL